MIWLWGIPAVCLVFAGVVIAACMRAGFYDRETEEMIAAIDRELEAKKASRSDTVIRLVPRRVSDGQR